MDERLCVAPHHGHIAPLRAQLGWLEEAGFKSVDCFWKYLDLARRSAIDSNNSAVRVRGSLRAIGTAPLLGIASNAGYRQAFETTNEFVRIKF
jgi:hypothetical protein